MAEINPDDFIITRKRKKYKFALFANSSLCFEVDEWIPDWPTEVVELGAGTGLSLVELASRHPEKNFLAVDVKADRLQKGARQAEQMKLGNIRFLRARADQLVGILPKNSLGEIWLTFADPFPKKRAQGRRMTHSNFLRQYRKLLRQDGSLIIKHDNLDFFHWTLEQLVSERWQIAELSFDLHESDLSDEYKILTTYEQRWLEEGRKIFFVGAQVGDK